ISGITSMGISLSKKTHLFFIANLVYLLATYLFIRIAVVYFGLLGVANALLLGQIVYFIVVTALSQKSKAIPYSLGSTVVLMSLMLMFSILYIHITRSGWDKLVLSSCYLLLIYVWIWYIVLSDNERNKVLQFIQNTQTKLNASKSG
ncbi:MAG: hypothetical protein NTW16_05505, partial [Bacteroidetes bacterium]|nr:hypothetical protein [Bacteroidota bacterium]